MSDRGGSRPGWRLPLAATMILLAALWLHAPAWRAPFFADDYLFLEQVRGRSLPEAIAAPDPLGNFLRPVSRAAYFWTMRTIAGERPSAFRAFNLVLLIGSLALLAVIARRAAGPAAAAFATGYLALHYALDVPALWVSGAQDLLAVGFALSAIVLHLGGRTWLGACALLLGLLSKESVAAAAIVATAAAHAPNSHWRDTVRRAAPLLAVTAAWAAAWLLVGLAPGARVTAIAASPADVPAAFAQLGRVALGLEFRQGGVAWLADAGEAVIPIALAALALVLVSGAATRAPLGPPAVATHSSGRGIVAGIVWAMLGALPVVAVAPIWSAYFYLFALCGVGLALGSALTGRGRPVWLAPLALVAIGSALANARALDEFALAPNRWSPHSHLNRFYLERGMERVDRYLSDLKRARPTLPPRSTLFFANLPSSVAFQTADGPLVRWAYADTSLRSYFVRDYTGAKAARGPVMVFAVEDDRLVDKTADPDLFPSLGYSMLVQENFAGAIEALEAARARAPKNPRPTYLLAWARIARGEPEAGAGLLRSLGLEPIGDAPVDSTWARALAERDTARAVAALQSELTRQATRGSLHGELAALLLHHPQGLMDGVIEAFAYRALAPEDPQAWRLWAGAQLQLQHTESAARSLDRYFAIGGERAAADEGAQRVRRELRRYEPGGDLAQESLRH